MSLDFIVCVIGFNVYPEKGDLIIITNVDPGIERLVITDLIKLTDFIRIKVLESTLAVACRIGRVVRREGEPIGVILILGDPLNVPRWSRPLIPNIFHGHQDRTRRITRPDTQDALVEFSKLDGAFVTRRYGFIPSAGVFLATIDVEMQLSAGLGVRQAAAIVIAHTVATAVVVSATDDDVPAFSEGRIVFQMRQVLPYGPVILDE